MPHMKSANHLKLLELLSCTGERPARKYQMRLASAGGSSES